MSYPPASPSAVYYVPSSANRHGRTPRYYCVGEFPDSRQVFRCQCTAAQSGRRCWHVEAVVAGMVQPARPRTPALIVNSNRYA